MKTLIILNPHAGSGRAGRLWSQIEPLLWKELGELVVAVTEKPQEVAQHLENARAAGLTRVIAIGGDGTNHALVNELIRLNRTYPNDPPMTFGCLPIGTGQDWSRTIGIPRSPEEAVHWIKGAHPAPLDVGELTTDGNHESHFLNIASVGISGQIAASVNRVKQRHFWSYHVKIVEALLSYKAPHFKVTVDGNVWFDGKAYICAVANGQLFGRGLKIAPNAQYNDGLFDVVLVESMPRLEAIAMLNTLYTGAHLKRKDVHVIRGKTVQLEANQNLMDIELDGETTASRIVRFDMLPQALQVLTHNA